MIQNNHFKMYIGLKNYNAQGVVLWLSSCGPSDYTAACNTGMCRGPQCEPQLLSFQCSSLTVCLGNQWETVQVPEPLPPWGET